MRRHPIYRRLGLWFTRSNCFFFFSRWLIRVPGWRRHETHGYLAQRKTIHWKFFGLRVGWHWLYVIPRKNGKFWAVHYDPGEPFVAAKDDPWPVKLKAFLKAAFHKLLFKGKIRRYDPEYLGDMDEH